MASADRIARASDAQLDASAPLLGDKSLGDRHRCLCVVAVDVVAGDGRALELRHGGCSAGRKMANVDHAGDVHPCQFDASPPVKPFSKPGFAIRLGPVPGGRSSSSVTGQPGSGT